MKSTFPEYIYIYKIHVYSASQKRFFLSLFVETSIPMHWISETYLCTITFPSRSPESVKIIKENATNDFQFGRIQEIAKARSPNEPHTGFHI